MAGSGEVDYNVASAFILNGSGIKHCTSFQSET